MRNAIFAAILAACVGTPAIAQDSYVNGYVRSNGTYVQPYMRTAPDDTPINNYSTLGNSNPYTGERGTADPYSRQNENTFAPTPPPPTSSGRPYGSSYRPITGTPY